MSMDKQTYRAGSVPFLIPPIEEHFRTLARKYRMVPPLVGGVFGALPCWSKGPEINDPAFTGIWLHLVLGSHGETLGAADSDGKHRVRLWWAPKGLAGTGGMRHPDLTTIEALHKQPKDKPGDLRLLVDTRTAGVYRSGLWRVAEDAVEVQNQERMSVTAFLG